MERAVKAGECDAVVSAAEHVRWMGPVAYASAAVGRVVAKSVRGFLSNGIRIGSLSFVEVHAVNEVDTVVFGQTQEHAIAAGNPVATMHIADPASFYSRVALSADIGFAEAYIAGDFTLETPDDLVDIFRILILNRDTNSLSATSLLISRVGAYVNAALHALNSNSLGGSRRNIRAHYDLSNDLFATFLGKSWTYSSGVFRGDNATSLDDAQYEKLDMIMEKARLSENVHVLEVGCGWGEFAIRAAKRFGCRVSGITLSEEQLDLARVRAQDAGVDHLVDFKLVDYRNLPECGVLYDRVVSIEMIEAVGHEFLGGFFRCVDSALKPDGVAVLQVITTPEPRYEEYRSSADFIQKHIFPGGICPSLEALVCAMAKDSTLCIEHVENIGPHYATTLREWRRRFVRSAEKGDVLKAGFDDQFVRKWIYYFCYCEAGFASRTLGDLQLVLSRSGNVSALGAAPKLVI